MTEGRWQPDGLKGYFEPTPQSWHYRLLGGARGDQHGATHGSVFYIPPLRGDVTHRSDLSKPNVRGLD